MDCEAVREQYLTRLFADEPQPSEVGHHLANCPACREELSGLATAWAALGALPQPEPTPGVARRLRRRVRWMAVRETLTSPKRWQQAALTGILGFVLSLLLSLAVPYDTMVALCRDLVRAVLPAPAAYLLAGLLYGLIPMAAGTALLARRRGVPEALSALQAALVFLVVLLPYAVVKCGEYPLPLLVGFLLGITAGGVAGATSGASLGHRPVRGEPAPG